MATNSIKAVTSASEQEAQRQRLFFALWPDDGVRDRLHALAPQAIRGSAARRVSRENLHVTLVFLGSVDANTRDCVERVACGIQGRPFTLTLDRLGYWPKPRILWAGSTGLPEPLVLLVDALKTAVAACDLEPEKRTYRAHVTLARKVTKDLESGDIDPIDWYVNRFVLVESWTRPSGVSYKVLRSWDLG